MKFIIKNKEKLKYIVLFFFFLFCLIFIYTLNRGDTYVNFGFSYAITRGEVPYRDFNMVITPLAPFLYSIGLFFKNSILVLYMEQALLLLGLYIIIKKQLKDRCYLFLLGMLLPYPIAMSTTIFPGYNFLLFFFLILLYSLETDQKSDYLVGLILGLIFCTKQTIGILFFLPQFYYLWKNLKKFLKRLVGFILPIGILIIYLFLTKSFFDCFNLCFLGLFDFGVENNSNDLFYLFLLIGGILYTAYQVKQTKKIENLYLLLFSMVAIPIIDYYHVSLFLLGVLFLILKEEKLNWINRYKKNLIIIFVTILACWTCTTVCYLKTPIIRNYPHFELTITNKAYHQNVEKLTKYLKEKNQKVIYLLRGSENYFYKIKENQKLNYYDLPNYGNYGYQGIDKMKEKIEKEENVLFVLDDSLTKEKSKNQQYIQEYATTVKENATKIKTIGVYEIYEKNEK